MKPQQNPGLPSGVGMRLFFCFCLLLMVTLSCSSDSDNGDLMESGSNSTPTPSGGGPGDENPEPLSFSADIQSIINSNCVTCHDDPPTRSAPMPLLTFEQVVEAVENRSLLSRINSTTRSMPPEGRMPSATRQRIEDWINQGTPE